MKTFSLLLLLLSLSSLPFLLHAQEDEENPCEYDCVHGTCVQAEDSTDYYCECETNWFGDDCTIYDKYLNSEEVARDVVGRGEWKYYRHEVQSSGVKLTWFMNATRDGDDPDLYLKYGGYPSQRDFDDRNLTTSLDSTLVVEEARAGVYYVGVFGYQRSYYNIKVTEARACEDNCNGQGACTDGVCHCYPNYGGEWCQYTYKHLLPGAPQFGQVEEGGWEYFNTEIDQSGSNILYTVTELSVGDEEAKSDCDLYLAYERTPDRFDFDFVNITLGDESTITVTNAHAGEYTMGIYGYSACSFRISIVVASPGGECPNKCSSHGSCFDGECDCANGFSGEVCEYMDAPLTLNRVQMGYVGENTWNYYTARVITNSALIITLTQEEEGGDCDLFVKADWDPTRYDFDYRDQSLDEEFSIIIREPGDHIWHIGVDGWKDCLYSLKIDEEIVCACGEDAHGECEEGSVECVCEEGWGGVDCLFELVRLENGGKVSSFVEEYQWRHFELPVDGTSAGVISLKEKSSTGLIDLYVSFIEPPTLSSYDLVASNRDENVHEIQISVTRSQSRMMYIGVYGNAYGAHPDEELEFDLIAWAAPF